MQFIEDYFIVIVCIGIFILFALVGYLVESSKNIKSKEDIKLDEVEISNNTDPNINKEKEIIIKEVQEDNNIKEIDDDLLYNYDNETK